MCGLCGILERDPASPADEARLRRMTEILRHRGPDGEGHYVDGPVALGHRRLSIIDLSTAGQQPMPSADGRYWIILNGEIYNYKELRKELEAKGHAFRSQSDTEVLLQLYAARGTRLPEASDRHVRVCRVGRADAPPVPGARSLRHQADVLRADRHDLCVRVGDQGAASARAASEQSSIRRRSPITSPSSSRSATRRCFGASASSCPATT